MDGRDGVRGEGERDRERRGPWQIRLADMTIGMLAVGLAAGVARGAREAWGTRAIGPGMNTAVPWERTAGVGFEVLAVLLAVMLAFGALGLLRDRRRAGGRGPVHAWPIAWRIAGLSLLLGLVVEESHVLGVDFATEQKIGRDDPGWGLTYRLRQGLIPTCGFMAILGVGLGMGAGVLFEDTRAGRRRPWWLFVPLAAVVGLLLAASYWPLIAYLVLIALEAVEKALLHNLRPLPGFASRMLRAGIEAACAAVPCLVLALVVARDFDRSRRGLPWASSRGGKVLRLVALLASVGVGAFLVLRTIPEIHPWLAEGFAMILGPVELALILGGFGLLSLGLAARTIDDLPRTERPRRLVWTSAILQAGLLGILLLTAFLAYPASSPAARREAAVPAALDPVLNAIESSRLWLRNLLNPHVTGIILQVLDPETMLWAMSMLGLAVLVLELTVRPATAGMAPLDRAASSPGDLARLVWLTVALTIVCLVALPIFIIGSQALVHLRLNYADWMACGWPAPF